MFEVFDELFAAIPNRVSEFPVGFVVDTQSPHAGEIVEIVQGVAVAVKEPDGAALIWGS